MLERATTVAAIIGITAGLVMAGLVMAERVIAGDPPPGDDVEPLTTEELPGIYNRPIFLTRAPGDFKRLFIVEKAGRIRIFDQSANQVNATPFLDLDALVGGGTTDFDERGLLGLAFHPNYQVNGQLYVYYTNNADDTVVARYTRSANPDVASPLGDTILAINQPPFPNHNGGWLGFGPDGYLYVATGDGGDACDPGERAQDITNQLLGKILRLDVNGDAFPADPNRDYLIPADNPFVGVNGDDEIWAYGLRNPWRNAFDRESGDLYVADVGQDEVEEINFEAASSPGGVNYGWDCMEGNACASISGCGAGACACMLDDLAAPFQTYTHTGGRCSITGGYVYRGCAIPSLRGWYFYADFCSEQIWSLVFNGSAVTAFEERTAELDPPGAASIDEIVSFGEDAYGELYIVDQGVGSNSGEIFRIVPVTPTIGPYDFDCNGEIDVDDLVILILAWGDCEACREDVNGDGTVDVEELIELILAWG